MDEKLKAALARLTAQERAQIEKEARQAALEKLDPVERREILAHAQYVIENMQMLARMDGKRPQYFGDESALELLSKIGDWLNDNPQAAAEITEEEHAEFIDVLKRLGVYGETVR